MTMENKNGDQLGDQLGDKGDKASGRHTIQQRETRRETMGDKGRQDLGKADTPSNTKLDTIRKH